MKRPNFQPAVPLAFFVWVSFGACLEFYNVAQGTGTRLGGFASSWFALFALFVFACVLLVAAAFGWAYGSLASAFISLREKAGSLRWAAALALLILPAFFFQYTAGGVIFHGTYLRLWIWILAAFLFAALTTRGESALGWRELLAALALTSASFALAFEFSDVTMYPFSLGWSEGNRLWDYSLLFGRERYIYPADKEIPALLDFGRQFLGGFPFLLPSLNIGMERFWVAFTYVFPYFIFGLALFRFSAKDKKEWLFLPLWVFLFLKQGPIHPPLLLSAAAVALAWNSPLAVGVLLTAGAGYFASLSRTTWIFAPAAWSVLLEFVGGSLMERAQAKRTWIRSVVLGLAGIFGGFFYPFYLQPLVRAYFAPAAAPAASSAPVAQASPGLLETAAYIIKAQPLLWYRLLPNATYRIGVLPALLIAVVPLLLLLLSFKSSWKISPLQKAVLLLPALVLLAVGLIASAKIGGGGDLHNMDMFLITLVFVGALAWYGGGREWLLEGASASATRRWALVLLLTLPAFSSLASLRPRELNADLQRLTILADKPDKKSLGLRPDAKDVEDALRTIRDEVERAKPKGEILFMDQRQLLTFGYIQDVPLVAEYEKKILINEALSLNREYFSPFYQDLAARRFSLIITSPLRRVEQGSENQFGEENNLWIKYVAAPTLCYYEPKIRLNDVGVHLLVPRKEPKDCSAILP